MIFTLGACVEFENGLQFDCVYAKLADIATFGLKPFAQTPKAQSFLSA